MIASLQIYCWQCQWICQYIINIWLTDTWRLTFFGPPCIWVNSFNICNLDISTDIGEFFGCIKDSAFFVYMHKANPKQRHHNLQILSYLMRFLMQQKNPNHWNTFQLPHLQAFSHHITAITSDFAQAAENWEKYGVALLLQLVMLCASSLCL